MTALFKDLKFDLGSILRERTMNLTRSLQAPAVPTFCVYSMGILTDDSYSWDKDNRLDLFPNNTRADGDGTVNIESAKMCNRWATDPAMKGKPFARKVFFKQQHRPMLFEEEVVFFIADTLINIAKDDFPVSMPPFQIDSEADDADVEAAAARVEAQDTEAEDWDHDFPIPDHPDNLVNQMKKSATKVGGRTLMEPVGGYGFMPLNISTVPFARDADPAFASSSSSSSSSSTVKVSIL